MEKNKQDLKEDIFLKKYLQEIDLESPNSNFTNNIMDTLLQEEKKTVLKNEPLISKKMWFVVYGFIAICVWFLYSDNTTSSIKFPSVDLSFLNKIQIPNLFDNLSISNTLFYAIAFFTAMVFVQIMYLKNHFNKRFE